MKTKFSKSGLFRKIFVSTILCLGILGTWGTALAEEASPPAAPEASETATGSTTPRASSSFSVGTYLKAENQQDFVSLPEYIVRLINTLSMMIGSFAFLAIVIGGFMMVTSGGREASITKGKDIIKYAVLGLIVALAAFFITSFVQSIFYEYKN